MEESFDVHFGIVASGDEGIVDPLRAKRVARKTPAPLQWHGREQAERAPRNSQTCRSWKYEASPTARAMTLPSEFEANLPDAVHNVAMIVLSLARLLP